MVLSQALNSPATLFPQLHAQGYHLYLVLFCGIPGIVLFSVGVPVFSAWFLTINRERMHERGFIRTYRWDMSTDAQWLANPVGL